MDEKRLFEVLRELGLSKRETDVYLFLSRKGPQKAHSVAAYLNVDRAQAYRSLTSLQEKGMVELTIEAPTRYIAVPIEPLVESFIKARKNEIAELENEKKDLIDYFQSIRKTEPEYPMAKFQVVMGENGVYSKISQMINESKSEVLALTTSVGLIQEDTAGILDDIFNAARQRRTVQFKLLATFTKENLSIVKQLIKKTSSRSNNVEWRHLDLGSRFYPRFVIKDQEETILYMTSRDESTSLSNQEGSGLWINSKMFVSTLRASFMEIWRSAIDAAQRITELETGTPREETLVIKELGDAQAKINSALNTATEEVTIIASSAGLNRLLENEQFRKYSEKGIKFRIMAPIDLDNLESAQKLAKFCQVKHVSISYLTMMIVDGKKLFMFKSPQLEEAAIENPFYLPHTFYSSDRKYVERATELLNDIWKRGTDIREMTTEGPRGTPIVEVTDSCSTLDVVKTMLKTNASSVLVTKKSTAIGIIDQKDLLEKVLKTRKDPKEMTAKQIMSTPVLTVDADQPLIEALRIMKQKRIPRLAVMRKGKLIAMLT